MPDPGKQRSREERQVLTMVRWLLYVVFAVLGFLVLRLVGPLMTPVLAAAAIAYLLDGLLDRLAARGVNRSLAALGLLLGFAALVVAVVVVVVPLVSREIARFAGALPALIDRAAASLSDGFGVDLPRNWRSYLQGPELRELLEGAVGPASSIAATALGGVLGLLGWLAELLLVPVFAFYILVDWDPIVARMHALAPPRHREWVGGLAREIDGVVSTWVRGQLTVMAVLAALYATAFAIIGLHLGITIGITVGLLTVIPFLGTFVGAALALLMVLLDWQGPGQLVAIAAVFVVLHLAEAAVLTPRLVGKRVGLGEVGALLAVLVGGQLLGFTGVLLAVPIAASIAVLIRRALGFYQDSTFFTDGTELVPVDLPLELPRLDRRGPTRPLRRRARDPDTVPDPTPHLHVDPGPDRIGAGRPSTEQARGKAGVIELDRSGAAAADRAPRAVPDPAPEPAGHEPEGDDEPGPTKESS
ncbi:MAG TPA: AI-2E family transporter [Kofleriaceae bacterium]|nr:AI-2E family transporter [Kofleriaceae bacterium]